MFVLTGKSELERILSREPKYPAEITLGVERLIEDGQLPELCDDWTEDEEPDLADRVLKDNMCYCDKRSAKMGETLRKALAQIRGYRELCALVEARRLEKYDAENAHHEKRLLKLWDILMPDEKLINRVTKQWQKIGFQGDDPATDFRGMGVLSLDQLIFFAQYDVANAREVLSLCTNAEHELPMATAGITFTSMARNLLHKGIFKIHFYNTVAGAPSMDSFHRIYCHIFKLFYKFWVHREPTSIMEFSFIKNDFEEKLIESLTVESANLHKVDVNELFS
ncbi:ELMO domain-containing protein 2 [Toxocara canis]|uniref:ELMO domain-containing protein 2 n=1 Tax=Toxocara canis TaxID=6265 RepID=A0A0B2UYQ1_TOXCA|nr:ELMO domain-containing protein 2 [Toxocara canis]